MPKALLSVADKTGLVEFAQGLHEAGWELIASGGTATVLAQAGLPVKQVSEVTGSPEILGGRVKTLHPVIHGGLLARNLPEDIADLMTINASMIDLVAVNLYPFQQTVAKPDVAFEDAIENIDIGGVALIRAAAKNHARVAVVVDPADYPEVLVHVREHNLIGNYLQALAMKAFIHTAEYDAAIATWLSGGAFRSLTMYEVLPLRYGENPHQRGMLYSTHPDGNVLSGQQLQGKELSYTNVLDLEGAWRAAVAYETPAICIVKHVSPCGIATHPVLAEAFRAALASDPISAFGGVIASNRPLDLETVEAFGKLFIEAIIAPGYSPEALERLAKRPNCRLIAMPSATFEATTEMRTVMGGVLTQDYDRGDPADAPAWQVVSARQPTEAEMAALRFAWTACMHVKSNAIVLAKGVGVGAATVGIGGGQPNRVDCVKIAGERAGEQAVGSVMASDAFFPFPDSVELAGKLGVTAIVQPGGSVRDEESIAAANAAGIAMVVTGQRHFRH